MCKIIFLYRQVHMKRSLLWADLCCQDELQYNRNQSFIFTFLFWSHLRAGSTIYSQKKFVFQIDLTKRSLLSVAKKSIVFASMTILLTVDTSNHPSQSENVGRYPSVKLLSTGSKLWTSMHGFLVNTYLLILLYSIQKYHFIAELLYRYVFTGF